MEKGTRVLCKNCNRYAMSPEFVLDPVIKMMVCSACVKERRYREQVHSEVKKTREESKKQKVVEELKPAGWDKEDDMLDKVYKMKMRNAVKVDRIDGTKVKYTCQKCKYKFIYDEEKRRPNMCPYCSTEISKVFF